MNLDSSYFDGGILFLFFSSSCSAISRRDRSVTTMLKVFLFLFFHFRNWISKFFLSSMSWNQKKWGISWYYINLTFLPCVRESLLYKYSSHIVERTEKMLVAVSRSEDNHKENFRWRYRRWSPWRGSRAPSTQDRHPPRTFLERGCQGWRSASRRSRWGLSPLSPTPPSPWTTRAPGGLWSSQDLKDILSEILVCFAQQGLKDFSSLSK